jgi:cellulase
MLLYSLAFLALFHVAHSHFWITKLNGVASCRRKIADPQGYQDMNPVKGAALATEDAICNRLGLEPAASTCVIRAGDRVEVEWNDPFHPGPCHAYLAPKASGGRGNVWFKIFDIGKQGDKFCSEILKTNGNKMAFTMPSGIPAGDYILRADIIALHIYLVPELYGAWFLMTTVS